MSTITVTIKWGKETFKDVKVDLAASSEALRSTIEALTGEKGARRERSPGHCFWLQAFRLDGNRSCARRGGSAR
jgi:hypothetical protein